MTTAQQALTAYFGGAPRFGSSNTFLGKKIEANVLAAQPATEEMQVDRILGSKESARYRETLSDAIPVQNRNMPNAKDWVNETVTAQTSAIGKAKPAGYTFAKDVQDFLNSVVTSATTQVTNVKVPKVDYGPLDGKTTKTGVSTVNWAQAYLGVNKYDYGAWDCSAFTSLVTRKATGVNIGRSTAAQIQFFRRNRMFTTDIHAARPGDILYFNSKDSPSKRHTGIYIGNGMMIDNSGTGEPIAIRSIAGRSLIGVGLASRL